jgi:photosystem II stability/assembly factor-like uncharacterized protein
MKSFQFTVIFIFSIMLASAQTKSITKDHEGHQIRGIQKEIQIYPDSKGGNEWNSIGPFGGDVVNVAVNPQNTDIIFAAAGYPFMSEDGGATWKYLENLAAIAPSGIYRIAVNENGVVFAGGTFSSYKIFRSTDGGFTWELKQFPLNRWVESIEIDPNDPDVIYLGLSGDAAGVNTYAMAKSEDGGDSWTTIDLAGGMPAGYNVVSVCVDPGNSQNIIVAGAQSFSNAAIAYTTDGGDTWLNKTSNLPTGKPFNAVAIADGKLYVGGGQLFGGNIMGVYESTNGGSSWANISNSFPNKVSNDILIDPNDPLIIYVASEGDGIYKSTDGGVSWNYNATGAGENGAARSLAFEPGNTDIIYGGFLSLGVCKSEDTGLEWEYANVGIASLLLNDIEIDPNNTDRIICSFEAENSGGCYISLDGGETWDIPSTIPGTRYSSVTIGPDGTLYAWSNGPSSIAQEGLYKSVDDGATWENLGPNIGSVFETEIFSLAGSDTDPDLIFIGGNNFGANGFESIVYKTEDGGENWEQIYLGPSFNSFNYIFIDPNSDDAIVYASYMSNDTKGGFIKSLNSGNSFIDINTGLPNSMKYAGAIITDPYNPDIVYGGVGGYGGVNGTIYKSESGGLSWSPTALSMPTYCKVTDLVINPEMTDIIYASTTQNGVMLSLDAAETWESANSLLPATFVTGFSKPFMMNDSLHMYASTYTHSAFETKLMEDEISGISKSIHETRLVSIYPNPTRTNTSITFSLDRSTNVIINIYNAQGQLIQHLINDNLASGNYKFNFKAGNGIYFCESLIGGKSERNKIIIIE